MLHSKVKEYFREEEYLQNKNPAPPKAKQDFIPIYYLTNY